MVHRTFVSLFVALLGALPIVGQCANASLVGGSGCGFSTPFGIPMLSCAGSPNIGNTSFGLTSTVFCPSSCGALLVGPCRSAPILFTSGFGTGGLCGPTEAVCAQFLDPCLVLPGVPQGGGYSYTAPIPNDPQLVGLHLCAQSLNLCTAQQCIGVSNAVSVTLL